MFYDIGAYQGVDGFFKSYLKSINFRLELKEHNFLQVFQYAAKDYKLTL